MDFTELYPARVTLGRDGIYRWSYSVDMSRDHSTRDQFKKAILIVCGSVFALNVIIFAMLGDFSMLWIPAACTAFVLLISFPIYKLCMAGTRNRYDVAYELNEEAILTVRSPATQEQMGNVSLIVAAIGAVSGHPLQGAAYGMSANAASQPVLTRFRNIRAVGEDRENNRLDLKVLPVDRQVWVPAEDYDMVLNYIRKNMAEQARREADEDHYWRPLR